MTQLQANVDKSKNPDQYTDDVKRFALTTFNRINGLDGYQNAVIRIEQGNNRSVVVDNVDGNINLLVDLMSSKERSKFAQKDMTNNHIRFVYTN